jgi:hypothetical protein
MQRYFLSMLILPVATARKSRRSISRLSYSIGSFLLLVRYLYSILELTLL